MRRIERTNAFKRDYKRVKVGELCRILDNALTSAVALLASDVPMPLSYRDHPLAGEWKDHRDCHLRPDLLLLYRKPDSQTLQLVRLGSHSELFG